MANYSLFQRMNGKWVRVAGAAAYPKQTAVRLFQDRLINSAFSDRPMSLRPVKEEAKPLAPAQVLCTSCDSHLHNACLRGDCACACRHFNG